MQVGRDTGTGTGAEGNDAVSASGLYVLPAMLNHSCDPNCTRWVGVGVGWWVPCAGCCHPNYTLCE